MAVVLVFGVWAGTNAGGGPGVDVGGGTGGVPGEGLVAGGTVVRDVILVGISAILCGRAVEEEVAFIINSRHVAAKAESVLSEQVAPSLSRSEASRHQARKDLQVHSSCKNCGCQEEATLASWVPAREPGQARDQCCREVSCWVLRVLVSKCVSCAW